MHDTKFSIVVPMFNAASYIKECIESVLVQTVEDWELIVVDDGSTDNSLSIATAYANNDNRIRVVSQTNSGVSAARNVGIELARGEYVEFLDADDYLLSNALEVFSDLYKKNDADLVLANVIFLNKGDKSLYINQKSCLFSADEKLKFIALWSYMFRLNVIKRENIRFVVGLAYSEDCIFIYEYCAAIRNIRYSKDPVYVYRIHDQSVCRRKNDVRKATHNLWAASIVHSLAERMENERPSFAKTLNEEYLFLKRISFYLFGKQRLAYSNYSELKSVYRKFNGNSASAKIYFYRMLFSQFFKYRKELLWTCLYKTIVEHAK